jgi:co-chaperonin GroES (HSP10)
VNNRPYQIASSGANVNEPGKVNFWDKKISVRRNGYIALINNPNYRAPESLSQAVSAATRDNTEIKTPKLLDRIKATLECHASINEDFIAVVTDMPHEKTTGGLILPDESKVTPHSGVIVLCGRESLEKGPPGIGCGKRVTYSMMAGTGFPFAKNWEMRVLHFKEIRTILVDDSGVAVYRKAHRAVFGKAKK